MLTKLIGIPNESVTPNIGCVYNNYARWTVFTALATGNMNIYRIYRTAGLTGAYVAVYSDNAGFPGTPLVTAQNLSLSAGWNDIPIADVPITMGTDYWLATILMGSPGILACAYAGPPGFLSYYKAYGTVPTWETNPGALSSHGSTELVAGYNQGGVYFMGVKG